MKKTITIFLFAIMFFNVNGQSPLKNEVDSISYLIGQSIAKNVLGQMGEANKDMIMKGMGDGLYEIPALCSDPNNAMLNAYFQEKNRIKENRKEPNRRESLDDNISDILNSQLVIAMSERYPEVNVSYYKDKYILHYESREHNITDHRRNFEKWLLEESEKEENNNNYIDEELYM